MPRAHEPLRARPRLRRPRDHRHGAPRPTRSPRSASSASTRTRRAARRRSSEWRTLVNPGRPDSAGDPGADRASPTRWCATRRRSRRSPTKSPRGPPARSSSRTTRASTTASSSTRSRASSARSARACCARCELSRRLFPDAPRHNLDSVIERHALPVDDRHRALGDARVLWAFVQALYRDLAPDDDRRRREARAEDAEPAAAARPRCARRAARSARRLSVLRTQRAAALHRQEPQPARARRRAFLVRLSIGDRLAPVRRDSAHRIRGNGRRDRRAAARIGAREVDAAGAQPRAAPQGRIRRARVARRARAAALPSGRRRRSRRELAGTLRAVHVEARGARDAAPARTRACALLERARTRAARRVRASRARCAAARARASARNRRRRITRGCATALAPLRGSARGRIRGSPRFASARSWASAPTSTCCATGAGSAPRTTTASSARLLDAPPRPVFDADIAKLLIRTLARGRHEVLR